MMSKSIKHLVTMALFTAMALTIFVIEAQIPVPIPIPGVKLGLSNVITLIILLQYRPRDAAAVLLLRILLGSIYTGRLVAMFYSLCGGFLCFGGMALLCWLLHKKQVWFISIIGAVLHNIGQILAAMLVMQTTKVLVYLPFLLLTGTVTGLFTGLVAGRVVHYLPPAVLPEKRKKTVAKERACLNAERCRGNALYFSFIVRLN